MKIGLIMASGFAFLAANASTGPAATAEIKLVASNAINVMKDTALASVVAMPDLLKQATQAQALAANPTPLISAALIYLVILLPCVRLVGVAERRFNKRGR